MTVAELIQALQQLDQPDLEVWVPCPHCEWRQLLDWSHDKPGDIHLPREAGRRSSRSPSPDATICLVQ